MAGREDSRLRRRWGRGLVSALAILAVAAPAPAAPRKKPPTKAHLGTIEVLKDRYGPMCEDGSCEASDPCTSPRLPCATAPGCAVRLWDVETQAKDLEEVGPGHTRPGSCHNRYWIKITGKVTRGGKPVRGQRLLAIAGIFVEPCRRALTGSCTQRTEPGSPPPPGQSTVYFGDVKSKGNGTFTLNFGPFRIPAAGVMPECTDVHAAAFVVPFNGDAFQGGLIIPKISRFNLCA